MWTQECQSIEDSQSKVKGSIGLKIEGIRFI